VDEKADRQKKRQQIVELNRVAKLEMADDDQQKLRFFD
jgi:hypothetical protein